MRKKLISVGQVPPGGEFTHYGQAYRRATDEELLKHPGRENPRFQKGDVILAYGLSDQPVPVTFVGTTGVLVVVQRKARA